MLCSLNNPLGVVVKMFCGDECLRFQSRQNCRGAAPHFHLLVDFNTVRQNIGLTGSGQGVIWACHGMTCLS